MSEPVRMTFTSFRRTYVSEPRWPGSHPGPDFDAEEIGANSQAWDMWHGAIRAGWLVPIEPDPEAEAVLASLRKEGLDPGYEE